MEDEHENVDQPSRVCHINLFPYRGLAAGIILNAIEKWNKTKVGGHERGELVMFFQSGWFEFLAESIDMPPEVVLKKLNIRHRKERTHETHE
jgi:hypothetical protein